MVTLKLILPLLLLALVYGADARRRSFLREVLENIFQVDEYDSDYYKDNDYTCDKGSHMRRGLCYSTTTAMSYAKASGYLSGRNLVIASFSSISNRRHLRRWLKDLPGIRYIFIAYMNRWRDRRLFERSYYIRFRFGRIIAMDVSNGRLVTKPSYYSLHFVTSKKSCKRNEWLCMDHKDCIKKKRRCNGRRDCEDGSDEENCGECGGTLSSSMGVILSPKYPSDYPNKARCEWKLQIANVDKIRVTVVIWDLEYYSRDRLKIRGDGKEWTFHGEDNIEGKQFTIDDNHVRIRFYSDDMYTKTGFNLTYEGMNDTQQAIIGVTRTPKTYAIRSGFSASFYRQWMFTSKSRIICYQIKEFYLDAACGIYFYAGQSANSPLINSYTGSQMFGFLNLLSYNGNIFVVLRCGTSFTLNPNLFRFDAQVSIDPVVTVSNYEYGAVVSPKLGSTYPPNANCRYNFDKLKDKTAFVIESFDLAGPNDYIEFQGKRYWVRSALQQAFDELIITTSTVISFTFISDGSFNNRGFKISFSVGCEYQGEIIKFGASKVLTAPENRVFNDDLSTVTTLTITCNKGGIFSVNTKTYVKKCRLQRSSLTNGVKERYFGRKFDLEDKVPYECPTGYQSASDTDFICTMTGFVKRGYCRLSTCSTDKIRIPLAVSPSGSRGVFSSGTVLNFRCLSSTDTVHSGQRNYYRLVGEPTNLCLPSGKFLYELPSCKIIGCNIPIVENMLHYWEKEGTEIEIGKSVDLKCKGYAVPQNSRTKAFCVGSNNLAVRNQPARCVIVDVCATRKPCGKHPCINLAGSFMCDCQDGYESSRDRKSCKDINECSKKNRRFLNALCHECHNTDGGYYCTCKDGYQIYNSNLTDFARAVYGRDYRALEFNKSCIKRACPNVMPRNAMKVSSSGVQWRLLGMSMTYICKEGFHIDGTYRRSSKCKYDDDMIRWDDLKHCQLGTCKPTQSHPHGTVNITSVSFNQTAEVICDPSYELRERKYYRCDEYRFLFSNRVMFSWIISGLTTCQLRDQCPNLSNPPRGTVTISGRIAHYRCRNESIPDGNPYRICINGMWTGRPVTCQPFTCPVPELGGRNIVVKSRTSRIVNVGCIAEGYTLTGSSRLACELRDRWSTMTSLTRKTMYLCNNNAYQLGCPEDRVIYPVYANFGYDFMNTSGCPATTEYPNKPCGNPITTMAAVNSRCKGKRVCWIPVTDATFGTSQLDICGGKARNLEVTYLCLTRGHRAPTYFVFLACDSIVNGLMNALMTKNSSEVSSTYMGSTCGDKGSMLLTCLYLKAQVLKNPVDILYYHIYRSIVIDLCPTAGNNCSSCLDYLQQESKMDLCSANLKTCLLRNCWTSGSTLYSIYNTYLTLYCDTYTYISKNSDFNLLLSDDYAPLKQDGTMMRTYGRINASSLLEMFQSNADMVTRPMSLNESGTYEFTFKFTSRIKVSNIVLQFGGTGRLKDIRFATAYKPGDVATYPVIFSRQYLRSDVMKFTLTELYMSAFYIRFTLYDRAYNVSTDLRMNFNYTKPNVKIIKCFQCKEKEKEEECIESVKCWTDQSLCYTKWVKKGDGAVVSKGCELKKKITDMKATSKCYTSTANDTDQCISSCNATNCNGFGICPPWVKTCQFGMNEDLISLNISVITKLERISVACHRNLTDYLFLNIKKMYYAYIEKACNYTKSQLTQNFRSDRAVAYMMVKITRKYTTFQSRKCKKMSISGKTAFDALLNSWNSFKDTYLCKGAVKIKPIQQTAVRFCAFGKAFNSTTGWCEDPDYIPDGDNVCLTKRQVANMRITSETGSLNYKSDGFVNVTQPGLYTVTLTFINFVLIRRWSIIVQGVGYKIINSTVNGHTTEVNCLRSAGTKQIVTKTLTLSFYISGDNGGSGVNVFLGVQLARTEFMDCFSCKDKMREADCTEKIKSPMLGYYCYTTWNTTGNITTVSKGFASAMSIDKMRRESMCDYPKSKMNPSMSYKCSSSCNYTDCNGLSRCPLGQMDCVPGQSYLNVTFAISVTTRQQDNRCRSIIYNQVYGFLNGSVKLVRNNLCDGTIVKFDDAIINSTLIRARVRINFLYKSYQNNSCEARNLNTFKADFKRNLMTFSPFTLPRCTAGIRPVYRISEEKQVYRCAFGSVYNKNYSTCADPNVIKMNNAFYNSSIVSSVNITEVGSGKMMEMMQPGYISVMANKTYNGTVMFSSNVNVTKFVLKLFGQGMGLYESQATERPKYQNHKVLMSMKFWTLMGMKLKFSFHVASANLSSGYLSLGLRAKVTETKQTPGGSGAFSRRKREHIPTLVLTPKTVNLTVNYTAFNVNATPPEYSFSRASFWKGVLPFCRDTQPPRPISPQECGRRTFIERPTAPIYYLIELNSLWPRFTDNSGLLPFVNVTLPRGLSRFDRKTFVSTTIDFQATDEAGNFYRCAVEVMWKDTTKPRFRCPFNRNVRVSSGTINTTFIWPDVRAEDANGIQSVNFSVPNGTAIPINEARDITVTVTDTRGNTATCTYTEIFIDDSCVNSSFKYTTRNNIQVGSTPIPGGFGASTVRINCNSGYVLGNTFGLSANGVCRFGALTLTTPLAFAQLSIIPPCRKAVGFYGIRYRLTPTISPMSCCTSGFIDNLKDFITAQANCTNTFPTKVEANISYSADELLNKCYLNLDITLLYDTSVSSNETLRNCSAEIKNAIRSSLMINSSSTSLSCKQPVKVTSPPVFDDSYCPRGYLSNIKGVLLCVSCSKGTFYNSTSNDCESCDYDTYQDEENQEKCKNCSLNYGTKLKGATSMNLCIAKCRKGYSQSPRGLQPCNPCETGEYADEIGSTACMRCPGNQTSASGSTSVGDCGDRCPAGQFSLKGGLSPCTPCPRWYYQNETGQTSCILCSNNATTYNNGSDSVANCTLTKACEYYSSPCINGGNCTDEENYEYSCSCPTGYTGKNCQNVINQCLSSPCIFGNCTQNLTTYSCECSPGYIGINCDQRNYCFDNPCKNNATCRSLNSSYVCENCSAPFTGPDCAEIKNQCAISNPCLNGGNCTSGENSTSYSCNCTMGFTGPNCGTEIDLCKASPCKNNGTCSRGRGTYNCTCSSGWTGTDCQMDINECATNKTLCFNGGSCLNAAGAYNCECANGYKGFNCSEQINTCLSTPCKNSATCSSNGTHYTCNCTVGYEGLQCDQMINLCKAKPCDNNGTLDCTPTFNNFTCSCRNGFKGRYCNETASYCTPNPCLLGAQCVEGNNVQVIYNKSADTKFYCKCPFYRGGDRCQTQLDTCLKNKCMNRATCINGSTNYTCECRHGYNGTFCENILNLCTLDKPCTNGGTCFNKAGDYSCSCAIGWTGKNCSQMVDNCASSPCLNNGTCSNLLNDYTCQCTNLFDGKSCSNRVDVCLTLPCKNGGKCYNANSTSGFDCTCASGFNGTLCENNINDCPTPDPCKNGAVCQDMTNDYTCNCPYIYEGKHCNKTKSGAYDYLFSSSTLGLLQVVTAAATVSMEMTSEMSIQYWIRSFQAVESMFLRILGTQGTVVEMSSKLLKCYFGNTTQSIMYSLTNGIWTSIAINIKYQMLTLYVNGMTVSTQNISSFLVGNGTYNVSFGNVDNATKSFTGQMTQFFWRNSSLTSSEIDNLKSNCSNVTEPAPSANVTMDWRMIASGKANSRASQCGLTTCPAGFSGANCSSVEDNEPPKIVYCPSKITIVKDVALMNVTFREPEFSDNIRVVNIKKSGAISGSNLRPGTYQVIRVAVDAAGNEVKCQFQLTFVRYQCNALTAPNNFTLVVCSKSGTGDMYCTVSCKDTTRYSIPTSSSTYYSCTSASGGWSPRGSTGFKVAECVLSVPTTTKAQGSMSVTLPATATCAARRQSVIQGYLSYMRTLKTILPNVCKDPQCNDLKNNVVVNCGGARRRKRATSITLSYTLSTGGTASTDMCRAIAGGNSTTSFSGITLAASSCPNINPTCQLGYHLESGRCYACPSGTYLNSIYQTSCLPCQKGYYNPQIAQSACVKCPGNQTTPGVGATSSELCYDVCPAGKYLNPTTRVCEDCPAGTYQNAPGQAQCLVCRTGQVSSGGAVQCTSCLAGQQLSASGTCVACPIGFYRPNVLTNFICSSCPPNFITQGTGSTSSADCNLPICNAGEYRNTDKVCAKCPLGQFQVNRGQTSCDRCPRGQTTTSSGSVSPSSCKAGTLNECKIKSDNCDRHATCTDTPDYFTCKCNAPNWAGDGTKCQCAKGYSGQNCDVTAAPPPNSGVTAGIVVGSVFGAILLIAVIALIWYKCCRKQRKDSRTLEGDVPYVTNQTTYDNPTFDNAVYESHSLPEYEPVGQEQDNS